MTQKVSGAMLQTGAIGTAATGFTVGNYLRVGADGTLEEVTPTQVSTDIIAGGGGTVTSIAFADTTGLTVTGDPITSSGTITVTLSANLQAWHATSPTTYTGSATIATLGTVTTGTWNATTIAANRGGTGISSYTAGNYINALNSTTLQQRTPAQVRTDLGVTTTSDGTYTPTITGVANVSVSTPQVCQWMRVGNTVTVSGRVDIATTAAANTLTQVGISLPVASNFTGGSQCAGTAVRGVSGAFESGHITPDTTNDRAQLAFHSGNTASTPILFTFSYLVA